MNRNFFIIVPIFLLCITQHGYGQLQKGTFLVGGSMNLSKSDVKYDNASFSSGSNEVKSFNLNFSPDVSFLVTNQLAIGLIIPISYNKSESQTDTRSFTYSVGAKIRYYFPFERWAVFPELAYSLGNEVLHSDIFFPTSGRIEKIEYEGRKKEMRVGLGTTYFISPKLGIEGILSYSKTSLEYDSEFGIDREVNDIQFHIGFQVYLGDQN